MYPGEDYVPPVGFATEPTDERRRWIGRIVLVFFVIILMWVLVNRVVSPEDTQAPEPGTTEVPLPGPR